MTSPKHRFWHLRVRKKSTLVPLASVGRSHHFAIEAGPYSVKMDEMNILRQEFGCARNGPEGVGSLGLLTECWTDVMERRVETFGMWVSCEVAAASGFVPSAGRRRSGLACLCRNCNGERDQDLLWPRQRSSQLLAALILHRRRCTQIVADSFDAHHDRSPLFPFISS